MSPDAPRPSRRRFLEAVARREARHRRAQRERRPSPWVHLGVFGLVGWSVVVATLAGVALGLWLDARWEGRVSWTLTGLLLGLIAGCLLAWYWVRRESRG